MNTNNKNYEFLDVSEFPAPEPLQMALEAILRITPGRFLYLHHRKYPRLLFDRLQQRGFESVTRRSAAGYCNVFIWRQQDELARIRVMEIASGDCPWQV